ncbi:hypothetical protein [Nocardia sp. NPDC057030]|uniref:hypothetical protein n=1 Tax=unclassified Nocardia TaxID=2637762 RepID=UPI00363A3F76
MTTLVIPLFFVLAVMTAPPGTADAQAAVGPEPASSIGGRLRNEPVPGACTGSFCGWTRPAPLRVGDGASPLDPEFCEYVGPAPFFMSPSDSEFCGLAAPAPLALPSPAVE